jgi:Acyl-CoA dehydrogenase, C-terminal domain
MEGQDLALFERSLRHATERQTGDALDAALEELGWHEALALDPRAAVSTLFGLQGFTNATSSALDKVVETGLGLSSEVGTGLVHPVLGRTTPPGELVGRSVAVRGIGTSGLASRGRSRLVAMVGDLEMTMTVNTADLAIRAISGIDPELGLVEVSGEVLVLDSSDSPPASWMEAVAIGQLALAHELLGAARRMLELARNHALERVQFGQPISAFQAVRHRLADTLVAIEGADAAVAAAWDPYSAQAAAIGKALAGRAALTAARHCQQVLAGIGFTTEHPFHRYVRRVRVLEQLLGSTRFLTTQFGAELLRSRQLPTLLPL